MPHVQPSANIAQTGLGLGYVGSGYYQGASGSISIDDNETTVLEFVSPHVDLKAYLEFFYLVASSDDMFYRVYLNDLLFCAMFSHQVAVTQQPDAIILIPKLSKVKVTIENVESSTGRVQAVLLVARDVARY